MRSLNHFQTKKEKEEEEEEDDEREEKNERNNTFAFILHFDNDKLNEV